MSHLYTITHLVNGAQRTASIEARDADEAQERFIDQCEATGSVHGTILSICAVAHGARLLISPDGMRGARVHQLDAPNPLYAGWTDLTDLDDDAFHRVVVDRQLATLAAAA
jgi:hypothetical protein